MEEPEENSGLQPDRDIFGLEKQPITDRVFRQLSDHPEKPVLDVVYAGLGPRILAYFIDAAILFYPLYYIQLTFLGDTLETPEAQPSRILIALIAWILYYGLTESSRLQGTIGKKICSIKVIDDYGNRLTFRKAVARYLGTFVSILPLGFGIWAIATDKKKQGWHDALTGCFVVKIKEEAEPADTETRTDL